LELELLNDELSVLAEVDELDTTEALVEMVALVEMAMLVETEVPIESTTLDVTEELDVLAPEDCDELPSELSAGDELVLGWGEDVCVAVLLCAGVCCPDAPPPQPLK